PERDASLIEEKGVITEAQASKTISPVYPRISRRRGEEGVVVISVQILANGKVDSIKIIKSSGYQRLDKAAQNAAWATLFTPAKRLGQNVDSSTELSFAFRLTDD
ncbi:MAG: energy transducer TonB, partial [Pseudomonadota bacterium]